MRTSNVLKQGQIYTRHDLRELFRIADKTLDTGIFKPRDHDSVWLFVTEKKSEGMTGYVDRLDGDVLYWQGQTAGLKDPQIIEHAQRGLELVLFYRPRNDAYPGYGFKFEGAFEYGSHSGGNPTSFALRRVGTSAPTRGNTDVRSSATDMIQRLLDLRQSATGAVVSEAGLTHLQQRMHIPDAIEDWICGRINEWREGGEGRPLLVMLSGNAGDGKSDLIERLVPRIGESDDITIIRDATHAERPTDDQTALLAEFFAPFADGFASEPRLCLIAMNTGMALSFFATVADGTYRASYKTLERVVKRELGLSGADVSPPWDYEIINLDLRNVLPHNRQVALFPQMLDKLDPANPDGLLFEEAAQCNSCCVREWCFVHTNVQALQVPQVRENLLARLWLASLTSGIHLSPRNMWDFLYQVTTGGAEFFADSTTPCEKIVGLSGGGDEAVHDVHRRLIYNLLFEAPEPGTVRGPVLSALAEADPIRRVGRSSHAAESAAFNDPAADADALALAGRELAIAATGDEAAEPDACLNNLALQLNKPTQFEVPFRQLISKGVLRRAALFGFPSNISEELTDTDLPEYLAILDAYRGWTSHGGVPEEIYEYKSLLEDAIARIFGARVSGDTYFRQDSFSPSSRYAVYSRVDLGEEINPVIDSHIARAPRWLDAVNYRPHHIAVRIATHDYGWPIRGDFSLYRLFKRVKSGYAASSVDLEAFFGLRFACERLGGTRADATELVVRDLESGAVYRVRERTVLSRKKLELVNEQEAI